MNRPFRLYGKKRGNRRTGSGAWGRAAMLLFFSVFFAVGCGFMVLLIHAMLLPEWRVNQRFVEHCCTVHNKRLAEQPGDSGTLYRPELLVNYTVAGREYESWAYDINKSYSSGRDDKQAILDQIQIGQQYVCWYDPQRPETVVLVRGYTWIVWLMLLLPLTFVVVGGGGMIYQWLSWSTSTERRLAMAGKVKRLDLFDTGEHTRELPGVPRDADLTNSPGTRLAYRLPIAVSPGWALTAIVAACLFWNGMVSLFVAIAVNSHLRGEPEWFLTLFLVPFVLIGCGLVYYTVRELLIATGVGPTLVEISDHPLEPDGQYEIFLSQSGRLTMNSLKVLLVCRERATYQQGTNSRSEICPVFEQEIYSREAFEIQQGIPLEATAALRVPAGAMHSFWSVHNEVQWKLIVQGNVAGWPDYVREFPLLVYPPGHGKGSA